MTAGSEFWIVSTSEQSAGSSRDGLYSLLKSKLQGAKLIDDVAVFEVPDKIKFGRFDDLVSLLDDVQKQDNYIEQTCHRLEKMCLDIDPTAEFKIHWQRNTLSADEYLKKFVWDEAKYSNSRVLRQNVELIVAGVQKLADEIQVKAAQFQDLKNQHANMSKSSTVSLAARDLVDVLTPEVVGPASSFVSTEKLATCVCVVPHQEKAKFEKQYWRLNERVVPGSLQSYELENSAPGGVGDGLYSVTLMRTAVQDFRDACRKELKVTVRDFQYDPTAFDKKNEQRMNVESEKQRVEAMLTRICVAAFSECFVAWVHMKAARVYVEAMLRFGVNDRIHSFLLELPPKFKEPKARQLLNEILAGKNVLGRNFLDDKTGAAEEEEQMYPYIQLSIVPFVAH